jgi:hypothetical protein
MRAVSDGLSRFFLTKPRRTPYCVLLVVVVLAMASVTVPVVVSVPVVVMLKPAPIAVPVTRKESLSIVMS